MARQSLMSRLFWFGVGGALSVGLNAGPFFLLREKLHLPNAVAYAVSLTLVTVIFAVWNYYLNFRTECSLRECTARYLVCIAFCAALNYAVVLPALHLIEKTPALAHWPHLWLLVIATVQVTMGGVKFLLYHHWVYPHAPAGAA
jgi:putative flippase GtrA